MASVFKKMSLDISKPITRKKVICKSGKSKGRAGVYYYPSTGKPKIRSKSEMEKNCTEKSLTYDETWNKVFKE